MFASTGDVYNDRGYEILRSLYQLMFLNEIRWKDSQALEEKAGSACAGFLRVRYTTFLHVPPIRHNNTFTSGSTQVLFPLPSSFALKIRETSNDQ